MIATALSCAVRGLAGVPVVVEADVASGLPSFTVVGLTDRAIQESRDRVRAAVRNAGFGFPQHRVTVNLAPAEVPKEGSGFDLAIAVAVIRAGGHELRLDGCALIGELALDGSVRPVRGVLPMVRCLHLAGTREVAVATANAGEAALVEGLRVIPVASLTACVAHYDGSRRLPPAAAGTTSPEPPADIDLADVRGQGPARRALEVAAAGGHNLLMVGPPGAGKTMLARTLPSLLPDLTAQEGLEVAALYSLRGAFSDRSPTAIRPPFRAPHHTVSRAALIGGGSGLAQPGDISLAHRGVLFLDEVCEFPRPLLEALRQPLEERRVALGRSRGTIVYPADFALLAAANPCPCGHLGEPRRVCRCTGRQVDEYGGRLSGPMRDRIDLVVRVSRQRWDDLSDQRPAPESSCRVRSRVQAARELQGRRGSTRVRLNADLPVRGLEAACRPTAGARRLLAEFGERARLSARAYHRVLRVARTVADLGGTPEVDDAAVSEALHYRTEVGG